MSPSCSATSPTSTTPRSPTALGVPVGTVKSRIARGRGQLTALLGNRDPADGRPTTDGSATCPADRRQRPDMNDDQLLLASAYLDGDVDAAARAGPRPILRCWRRSTGCGHCATRSATWANPTPARRERAIAAALAAFVEEPSAPVAPPTTVVPLPHRPRRAWWGGVAAAAAVLVVVVAGAIVVGGGGGGGDRDDSAAAAPRPAAADGGDQEATLAAPDDSDLDAAAPAPQPATARRTRVARRGDGARRRGHGGGRFGRPAGGVVAGPHEPGRARRVRRWRRRRRADAAPGDAPACAHPGTYVGSARYDGVVVEVFADADVVSRASTRPRALLVEAVER